MKNLALALCGYALAFSINANADDAQVLAQLQAAQSTYQTSREDLALMGELRQSLPALAEVAVEPTLKYDILVLSSRVVYYIGTKISGDDAKLKTFEESYGLADKAKKLVPALADAYYYYGIALARWAETKGVIASLFRKQELMDHMQWTIDRKTRAGLAGEMIDGYGPNRVLGRMYFKLPFFAGGSHDTSVAYLKVAVEKAGNYAINVNYYAETLLDGNDGEKTLGCKLVNDLLAQDPSTINVDRLPETKSEIEETKALKDSSC